MRRAALASVSVSLLLVVIKTGAYFASHSVAMLASLADSALDLFASAVNAFAIRQALAPADAEHRFGHGKAEPLAGLAQGAFIAASAMFLALQAAQRIAAPEPLDNSALALAVMGISIAATLLLIAYQRRVVRATGSVAVEADRGHYASDLASNLGVIAALILSSWMGWTLADPVIALAVVGVMVWTAWQVGRTSLDQLMDHELPKEERARIVRIAQAHTAVKNIHDLKTRMAGRVTFIQLHLALDPGITLAAAHQVSDAVERAILNAYPDADVIIHQDPAGLEPLPPDLP
jgi:ferrous-iron efflux pump FieF